MKQALENVYTVFEKHGIVVSIPVNDDDIKSSQLFFYASSKILDVMLKSRTTLTVVSRGAEAGVTALHAAALDAIGGAGTAAFIEARMAARTTARATSKIAFRAVAVGANVVFAAWDGFNIYSTWKTDSATVKQIENILKELE